MPQPLPILSELARSADACEVSWSCTDDEAEERVLFFFEASVAAAGLVARAAQALAAPSDLIRAWSAALPGADAIGLALRPDRRSVRLYTQYWEVLAARVQDGRLDPWPLYRGFKALPDGSTRHDGYLCLPAVPRDVFWPPMAQSFALAGLDAAEGEEVLADLDAGSAIFTVTEGAGRQSWLTTVRRAQIDRMAVSRWLEPLAQLPGGKAVVAASRSHDLVHLAGGTDAVKGRFLTVYLESTPDEVLGRLGLAG